MINVHLNGDIVRCPDIASILARDREIKDQHNICRYNIQEDQCSAWQQSLINWQAVKRCNQAGRCMLSGSDFCPGHQKQTLLGQAEKKFKIDNTIYRKLASSAHYLVKESKTKTLFLTLTFPPFKKKPSYYETNKCFSKFVENLRTNYFCEGYIAVREFGKYTHRVHYHLLCAIPFTPFNKLNAAWCTAISDFSNYSGNAVQTDSKTKFIKNPIRAMRYVCKYFSKAKGQRSGTRLVFFSNNILQRPKNMDAPLESLLDSFKFDYMKQTSDYTTCYRITDEKEFNRFCDKFLYPFFELSTKKTQSLYAFPVNSS
jgi:hypothetical protein